MFQMPFSCLLPFQVFELECHWLREQPYNDLSFVYWVQKKRGAFPAQRKALLCRSVSMAVKKKKKTSGPECEGRKGGKAREQAAE